MYRCIYVKHSLIFTILAFATFSVESHFMLLQLNVSRFYVILWMFRKKLFISKVFTSLWSAIFWLGGWRWPLDSWSQCYSPSFSVLYHPATSTLSLWHRSVACLQQCWTGFMPNKMCINFRDLSRIAKLNTQEFLEFVHHQNFICIEYQDLENTPN